jgi:transposase
MLSLPATVRIWLAAQPVDLRKSFDGLAAMVREGLQGDPLSGDIFVFRNKAADRIKLLLWEEDGYAIWYKRLEAGRYRFPLSLEDQPRVEGRGLGPLPLPGRGEPARRGPRRGPHHAPGRDRSGERQTRQTVSPPRRQGRRVSTTSAADFMREDIE